MTEELQQLAAEYALGVLSGDELRQAEALFAEEAAFREEVARWRGRFTPLLDEVGEAEPPSRVWASIDRLIGGDGPAADNVARLRQRLNVWRGVAAGATALAAGLAAVLVVQPSAVSPPLQPVPVTPAAEPLMAMLRSDDQRMMVVATWDASSRRLGLSAAGEMPEDPGHAHELWIIPAGGQPRSLGSMPTGDRDRVKMQVEEGMVGHLKQGATLAISVEPMGGSPTGLPTGPVIASGSLERA